MEFDETHAFFDEVAGSARSRRSTQWSPPSGLSEEAAVLILLWRLLGRSGLPDILLLDAYWQMVKLRWDVAQFHKDEDNGWAVGQNWSELVDVNEVLARADTI